ncbi:histone-lysine N-methyltransferase eggless-like protein [Aphelenchoides avenae]|nr:histone-lysine N-methyltransferase eggless-like protein [Aphelenchus avenae]
MYSEQRFNACRDHNAEEDTKFCAGCSCKDNCADDEKCECIQRTKTEAGRLCPSLRPKKAFGYAWKYLQNPKDDVYCGLYECNQYCACNSQCQNRVAQLQISIPLEVYKTAEIGWGVRTRVDLPPGRFVCTYAGTLHDFLYSTVDYDSRYYANLGLYHKAEKKKDEKNKGFNLVDYFGPNEHLFILDAKRMGNIGGLFNHSCEPNLSVHYVFYDTHDIRLPLHALFTNQFVPAGSPLTWDYAYEQGQEEGTIIYCKCGTSKCRKRLL